MDFLIYIIILLYSIILHEIAHGYAAYKNGDDTAFRAGRLTLNPIPHISLVGSIIVPIFTYMSFGFPFGWANPVPYNASTVRQNKYGELQVSSAGVLMNFFLSFIAIIIFHLLPYIGFTNQGFLENSFNVLYLVAVINVLLGSFNLLPFPPADGWHIFTELYRHIKDIYFKIKSNIYKRHIYSPYYTNHNTRNLFENKMNAVFYNPIFMIISIYLAVQVFDIISRYILGFINYLFILQF